VDISRGPDPRVEGARLAARAFGPLARCALAEVDAALSALIRDQMHLPGPRCCLEILAAGQRAAAHAWAFLTRALPLLERGATDRSAARGLVHYEVRGRAALDLEGGCTAAGWRARIEAQRLAGVRAFYLAMSFGLLEDLDRLADVGIELDELQPTLDAAQTDAFHEGLSHLAGVVQLLGDAQRVVCLTGPEGRPSMDLFRSAEPA
jgi:hypothetical protein